MKKILFVDDEPKVLSGLRRMLRSLRHEWDMVFVESGPEALSRLAAASFDVVVTDMRMPGMDGAQLLGHVVKRHPSVVRIILSGQCERSAVLKCVGPAHQFLTKPCDSETLKSTVARACRLRDHLPDEGTKRAVSCIQSLPSQPSLYNELTVEVESAAISIQHIGKIVSQDIAMSAKILQLVSSGFFGTPQRASDVVHAVELLGCETIRDLVEFPGVFFTLDREDLHKHVWNAFGDHGLSVAFAAKQIAQSETDDSTLIGDAYLAGLLHDIGSLVFASDSGEHHSGTLFPFDGTNLADAEVMDIAACRSSVGAYLMDLWGLPDQIVRTIVYHASPSRSADERFGPLAAVHVANSVMEEGLGDLIGVPSPIDMNFLERIGRADRLNAWRDICNASQSEGVLR